MQNAQSMLPSWNQYKIKQLIEAGKLLVGDGYRAKNEEFRRSGIPFARAGNVNNGFHFQNADHLPLDKLSRIGNKISQPGDVVFTSKGTVGRFAYVSVNTPQFVYSPQLCFWRSLDQNVIDSRFLSFWMRGEEFYAQFKGVSGQTDMAEYVSLTDQRRMQMTLPSIAEQRAIARTLGCLDNKIELNRRMNETLEAMACALFKDWFVDFGPVRAKEEGQAPYLPSDIWNLFPATLDIDALPDGWRRVPVNEIIEFNPTEPLRKGEVAPYLDMASLPTVGSWPDPYVMRPFGSGMRFRNGDTLLARITPCLENGKTALIQCLPDNVAGWGSTEYIVMRTKPPVPAVFAYLLARDEAFRKHAIQSMTGTSGRQRAQADSVAAYKIASSPDEKLWTAFTQIASPLFDAIKVNSETSVTLANARDTLLPKLISGELRIKDAERILGAHL